MPTIPIEIDELTAEWVTTVLQAHAPGATVDDVEVLDRSSGTTGRARLGLRSTDQRLPASVFVKLAPFTEERRALVDMVGMGVSEARFYTDLAAEVPVRTPSVWHADHDATGGYIMVLEDLTAAGATQPTQEEPDAAEFAGQVMDALSAVHAEFHASPRFGAGGDLAWVEERGRGTARATRSPSWPTPSRPSATPCRRCSTSSPSSTSPTATASPPCSPRGPPP